MGTSLDKLQAAFGVSWQSINKAREAAAVQRNKLADSLQSSGTTDAAVIAYGSLAREEWTMGSDIDWTLLIDGPAKPDQRNAVHHVKNALAAAGVKSPNAGGAFGSMVFSHELVGLR